ncbi:putative DNA-binding transcriptional regulator YafY [Desulfohalotomaculum tongense]|uniref:helix-turn-helix transcriptional regulator n=1 Tax=Desulforadius tongensis TaxID=1216062 RepID=UPI001959652C|nr:WYL domain-containing protein [Desulforadius tongensis]MBM7853994.1 putative DNA-binding transcriptional regulator YafY [Desulforadius tongensis]
MGRAKTKHNHAANLDLILNKLRESTPDGGVTLEELSSLCGVSKRNIYRYLNELEYMGIEIIRPVQQKPGTPGRGKYYLSEKTMLESDTDASLIMLMGLNAQKEAQYRNLLMALYEIFIRYLAAKYHLSLPKEWKMSEIHQSPVNELNDSKQPSAKEQTGTVFYLPTANKNNQPKSKKEAVKVILSPKAAEIYRNTPEHFKTISQEPLPDGSLLLTLRASCDNEILSWLFHWNGEAEIIEPIRIRKKLIDFCNNVLKTHQSKYLSQKASS